MSEAWDAYVNTGMIAHGSIDKGAIFSADGTGCWTTANPAFPITAAEMQEVAKVFTGGKSGFPSFHIGGEKYMTFKSEGRSLYGKKGKEAVFIVKTTQAILVGNQPESAQAGSAAKVVESLADYLISVSY